MIKFFKTLPLHLKSAFKSIGRRFGSALSSIFAVTVTLTFIAIFLVLALNLNGFSKDVESNLQVFVQIDETATEENYAEMQTAIEALPGVSGVRFSSSQEQMDLFLKSDQGGESYEILKDDVVLPAAFYVETASGDVMESVKLSIEQMDNVMSASYGGESITSMLSGFETVRIGGGILVAALSALAIFLISNTIKMNIHARRDEISIMRYVGASNLFIKIPFLMEGVIIGILGAIIPIAFTCFGYYYGYHYLNGEFFSSIFKLLPVYPFTLYLSLTLVGIGVVVGLIGSLLSVNKTLKWKR